MIVVMTREKLVEALSRQLKLAESEDLKAAASHQKDEEKSLILFKLKWKKKCQEAQGLSYEQAKKFDGRIYLNAPSCPRLEATAFKTLISQVNMDQRKGNFRITEKSDLQRALAWLPASKRQPATVCD